MGPAEEVSDIDMGPSGGSEASSLSPSFRARGRSAWARGRSPHAAEEDLLDVLPDEALGHILSYASPWTGGMYMTSKRFARVMEMYCPYDRFKPPHLPATIHLECDVKNTSGQRVVRRCIYTINQMLWDLPMNVQRFEWVPGRYCRARDDWSIKESSPVWKRISKCMKAARTMSDEYPHYCEWKMHENVLHKGYISEAATAEFLDITRCLGVVQESPRGVPKQKYILPPSARV